MTFYIVVAILFGVMVLLIPLRLIAAELSEANKLKRAELLASGVEFE